MAYMRHEKVDLVSLLVRRRLSSACQKARGRETSVKEKGLKTSGREDAWHWAGEKRREGAAGKAPVATREMPRGTGTGCGIEWSMPGTAARRPSSDGDEDAPLFRTKRMV